MAISIGLKIIDMMLVVITKKKKICAHVVINYANCNSGHSTNSN